MMPDAPLTIREAAIDPKWTVARCDVGLVLRIEHPRLGIIDSVLLGQSPRELAAALIKAGGGDA